MTDLKIKFVSDSELLAKYICFIAKGIQINKYSQGNYLISSKLIPKKIKTVHFPDLNYDTQFWLELENFSDYSLTNDYPQKCLEFVTSRLPITQPETNTLVQSWNNQSALYAKHLYSIFSPKLLKKINSITFLLTQYGTSGSFSRSSTREGGIDLICTARTDFGPENILQILVNCLITITQPANADVGTIGWYERNAIINYISKHSSLSPYLPEYKEDIVDQKLILNSKDYLLKLGFPHTDTLDIKSFAHFLTPQEKRLLEQLITKTGQIVTFDEAAHSVWGDQTDEKFSLYALAKVIESLRQKIRQQGINRQVIHTKRKQGYLLLNV